MFKRCQKRVQNNLAKRQLQLALPLVPPQDGTTACFKFGELKRFHDIIVGTDIKKIDPVRYFRARGHHNHR